VGFIGLVAGGFEFFPLANPYVIVKWGKVLVGWLKS